MKYSEVQLKQLVPKVLACYWVLLFISTHIPLSFLSSSAVPKHSDKLAHFIAYAGLMFLIRSWQWTRRDPENTKPIHTLWFAGLVIFFYSIIDELLQIPIERTADFMDAVADWIGGGIGAILFIVLRPTLRVLFIKSQEETDEPT